MLPGRIPRSKEVIVTGDNVDLAKPGEDIDIIGIYILRYQLSINIQQGFPVFSAYVEANSIKKFQDETNYAPQQEQEFVKLSKR